MRWIGRILGCTMRWLGILFFLHYLHNAPVVSILFYWNFWTTQHRAYIWGKEYRWFWLEGFVFLFTWMDRNSIPNTHTMRHERDS